MRPIVVGELDVLAEDTAQMPLIPHDHVIETFAAVRLDHMIIFGEGHLRRLMREYAA